MGLIQITSHFNCMVTKQAYCILYLDQTFLRSVWAGSYHSNEHVWFSALSPALPACWNMGTNECNRHNGLCVEPVVIMAHWKHYPFYLLSVGCASNYMLLWPVAERTKQKNGWTNNKQADETNFSFLLAFALYIFLGCSERNQEKGKALAWKPMWLIKGLLT